MSSILDRVSFALLTSPPVNVHKDVLPPKGSAGRVLPAAVIGIAGGHDDYDLEGDDSLRFRGVRVTTWASTESGADICMEAVRAKLRAATTFSVGASGPDSSDDHEEATGLYCVSVVFEIGFNV